jgi:hypothetical protein
LPTAPTPIDPLSTPPSTNDPVNFDIRADDFLGDLPTFGTQANGLGSVTYANAVEAEASATAAATSAASAVNATGTSATSTTSLTVGTGAKALTLAQTGKAFALGQPVVIARTSAPATVYMAGRISAFNSGTGALTVEVEMAAGSGTYTDWTIALSGPPAQQAVLDNFLILAADEAAALVYFG